MSSDIEAAEEAALDAAPALLESGPEAPPTAPAPLSTPTRLAAVAPDPNEPSFVHLVVHSEFSVHDGLVKVKELAERASALGMPAVALTDHVNLFALIKFYNACREAGIKAVVGADIGVEAGDGALAHCTLLAASNAGYRNLLRLLSGAYAGAASDSEPRRRGSVAREALLADAEGLIVLLGAGSDVGAALDADAGAALASGADQTQAEACLARWQRAFGDRVYLALARTGRAGESAFVERAVPLAGRCGVPVVAVNDVRFLDRDDFEAHETRVAIQEGLTLNDPRRERRYTEQQYLRSPEEMRTLFADIPEALANTVQVAKRCNVELSLGTYHLPSYPVAEGLTLDDALRAQAEAGCERFLATPAASRADADAYRRRLDYELGVIAQMGFSGYFLIVQEFVNWAREHDVPVGCRGSGTASLVAFSLDITDLDPIRYGLIFERLLNPERVSMPDLDIDFCMEGRERVIAHVAERYGHDAVGQIVTFGTMAARAVVRDVARAQGKPFGLADRVAKLIPSDVGMTLAKAMQEQGELRELAASNEAVGEIMDMAYKLEGVVRNTGKHAGGVVIAPSALTDFVPLYADDGGAVLSQFDLYDVESAGLVKFDFLGLKTLTIIDWAVAAINAERERQGERPLDVKNLPLDDAKTFDFLQTGETTAVFQLESDGMQDLVRRLKPDTIDDIIALVALYRPGPLQSGAVDDYIARKHGRAPVAYPHPRLEQALASTYGVMLYQEQVMNMAQLLAGFSLGQADLLRRAMAKKLPEEMASVRTMFLEGTSAEGVDGRVANDIFDQVEKFSGYAFPKAHAASYALLTFRCAYLKAHYPAQFMAAALSADMQNTEKVQQTMHEVLRMGLRARSPHINRSGLRFEAIGGDIRYGLGAVRNIGGGLVAAIVAERQRRGDFAGLADFCRRMGARQASKRVVETLVRCGAMDAFAAPQEATGATRARLLSELAPAVQSAEQSARDEALGIDDMLGVSAEAPAGRQRPVRALSTAELLEGEKETLGLYLSGHPLDRYAGELDHLCPTRIATLQPRRGDRQSVAGVVISVRRRRGGRGPMAFAVVDDGSDRIEVAVFGEVLGRSSAKLERDAIVVVDGEVQASEFEGSKTRLRLRAERVLDIAEARSRSARAVVLAWTGGGDFAGRLKQALASHRDGEGCAVMVDCAAGGASGRLLLGDEWRAKVSDELLDRLRELCGERCVRVEYA